MKTKQLANVLIKLLGLSEVFHSIPAMISGMFGLMQSRGMGSPGGFWLYPGLSMVMAAIGIYFIVKSRDIAEFLFKGEVE
jgi:hypothetical protein